MKNTATMIRLLFLALFAARLAIGKPMLWLGLFAISLLAAVVFGRVYCGYVCPMNTLMVPAEWISKKLNLKPKKAPKWLAGGHVSWLALVASIAALLLVKRLLQINLPILPLWLAIAVVMTVLYGPAVFHNLICPFGALQKWFGRFARFSKKVDSAACVGCKLCEKACPSDAIIVTEEAKKAVIDTALCHQCTNCQQACPERAIHYSK